MSEVQEKPHVPSLPLEQEKAGLAEHKEVASTPERASSTNDLEQVVTDEDHFNNTPWSWKDRIAALSLAGLYVGSQIPLYFVGGSLSFIAADIGGATASAWLPVSYALALAAVAPFSGYMQDLMGRRNITLAGGLVLIIGIIVLATAKSFGAGVVAMALAGAGAAIGELTALAGTAELVPVKARGYYLGLVTGFVLPFTPYLLYAQLLSTYHTWRWGIWICLMWNGAWFVGIAVLYFPQSQTRAKGAAARAILGKIDYLGGFLSVVGLVLFLVALQAGGYSHPWTSAYVLCTLLIGILLIFAFIAWEYKFCKEPMIPHEMFSGQRIVGMAYGIAFVAGMNFYAMLNFFPILFHDVFPPDPVQVGLKGLAPGLSTTFGAVFVNAALTWFKGWNRELLLGCTIIMTAFGGAMSTVTPDTPSLAIALSTMTGLGVGGVLVPAATVAVMVTPDTSIATCVALSLAIRTVGGSIGYAIYYNVFINKLTPQLPTLVGEWAVKAGLPLTSAEAFVGAYLTGAEEMLAQIPGVTPAVIEGAAIGMRWAYANSLKWVWISSIPFGICTIVACCFLGNTSKYMTDRVAARLAH